MYVYFIIAKSAQ